MPSRDTETAPPVRHATITDPCPPRRRQPRRFLRVALVGGSGFVGRHLAFRLRRAGIACRVLTRHAARHPELRLAGEVREIGEGDTRGLAEALDGCDAAVNLVGVLDPGRGRAGFDAVHVAFALRVVEACRQCGIRRLLHMSALRADPQGGSEYLRSKGRGEARVHAEAAPDIAVTSFRPSVIFGPDDPFLRRLATLVRLPGPLPLARAQARFAPVHVADVAEAFVRALGDPGTFGRRYALCGPEVFTLESLVRLVARHQGRAKRILRLPDTLGRAQAALLQHLPGRPFTPDQFRSLLTDSTCEHEEDGLRALGIEPLSLRALASDLLSPRADGLERLRRRARRPLTAEGTPPAPSPEARS